RRAGIVDEKIELRALELRLQCLPQLFDERRKLAGPGHVEAQHRGPGTLRLELPLDVGRFALVVSIRSDDGDARVGQMQRHAAAQSAVGARDDGDLGALHSLSGVVAVALTAATLGEYLVSYRWKEGTRKCCSYLMES